MKRFVAFVVIFFLGCVVGLIGGLSYEKARIKSADEISAMVDQTLEYHQKELDSLQNSTATEKKKLSDAARQILKKYLPEEQQEKPKEGR